MQDDPRNSLPARVNPHRSTPPAASTHPAQPSSSDAVSAEPALSLLEVLLRHPVKLIGCLVLALGLGVVYQLYAPRVYESSAEIFVEKSQNGVPNSAISPGGVVAGQPSTHASVLVSTPVLRAALSQPAVANSQTLAEIDEDARLRFLKKNISVVYAEKLETLAVRFRGAVREETPTIVNAVVAAYLNELGISLQAATAPPAASPADTHAVSGSASEVDRGVMSDQMMEARLMALATQLAEAQVAEESAAIRLAQATDASIEFSQLAALLDESGLDSRAYGLTEMAYLRNELARLEQQIKGMPAGWGPEHAVRGPVERQATALRREWRTLQTNARQSMVGLLEASQENARKRVAELDRRISQEQAAALRDAKPSVRVLELGEIPHRKAAPKGTKSLGVALVLGLLSGVGLILFSELRPSNAPAPTNPETLGLDPASASPSLDASSRGLALRTPDDVRDQLHDDAPPLLGLVPEVPSSHRLTSPDFDATASSIHQIRAVLQIHAGHSGARAFAFTSPRRGAGKTSVTIGVASSLAMSGSRTLVVDCDLAGRIARGQTGEPPQEHANDRFGPLDPDGSAGDHHCLDNVVLEQGYLSDDDSRALAAPIPQHRAGVAGMLDGRRLDECVVASTTPRLSFLPATHAQTRHIGMMSDAFIRQLIAEADPHFDLVLFDSGPVPGSVEALLVTSQVDGVVVVVPQGETREALARTMSYLKVVQAKVFGTVFNRAAAERTAADQSNKPTAATAETQSSIVSARHQNHDANLSSLEEHQVQTDDDGEFLTGDAPLGSGILAAAVFSDAQSGYASQDWKLEETSAFSGSVEELFGNATHETAADDDSDDEPKTPDTRV